VCWRRRSKWRSVPLVALVLAAVACSSAYGATLHVAPAGSDENDCSVIAPCMSLGRAYAAAAPGDVVEVAAGSYAAQRVDDDDSKDGARAQVSFRPALGATVTFADLLNYASNIRYSGFTIDLQGGGQPDIRGGRDVVLENLHATNFYIAGARRDISVIGGDYGPYASCGGGSQITPQWGDETDPTLMPTDILVEGVTFHDYTVPESCPDAHLDCLHVFPSVHVTVRNSTFLRCEHYGVLLNSNGPGNRDGHVIENNLFGASSVAGFALRGGDGEDYDDLTIRNNSGDVITPQVANTLSKVRWTGNAATDFTVCREGVAYSHNVSTLSKCGPTDVQAPPGFADIARDDYRLTAGAAALDAGDPADAPSDDHDGHARPAGKAPDAGALESGAELPAPPRPKVVLSGGPLDHVTTTTATFTFTADEADALQCNLDAAAWVPCASGITFKDLVDGPHQFQVRAVSDAGVVGDPETAAWIVDTQPPVLKITDGPEEGSRVPSSSFAFHVEASEPVTIFCNLDDVRWWPCSDDRVTFTDAVYTGIADGPHTFATYASDGTHAGETVTRHFSVAAEPIDTIITDGPKEGGLAPAAVTFTFKATEIDATFECRMDTEEWAPCTSPALYPLTSGAHHFEVRATDVGGTDATPATRNFTVDSLPPETYITGGTAEGEITAGTAVITFFSPEDDATFQCRLDGPGGHDWRACGSPAGYGDLPDGAYRFWVRAVDRAGNIDPDPQSRSFSVDTTPLPDTTITGGTPEGTITPGGVTYSFSGSPAGVFFECQLTGAAETAWQTCGSTATYDSLPEGTYTFWVRARDAFGRVDPTPATRKFTIDTTEPETTITGGPATGSTSTDLVAFSFTSDDPTAHFECRLDAPGWTLCTNPQAYSLAAGAHTFAVRAVDPAGNVDSFPATRNWTVKVEDHTPPETVIDAAAGDTFTFSSEPGATFECQLDSGAYATCTSPKSYPGLADGSHTFNVRATDTAGNPDPTPATRTWTVDHTPPETVINTATSDTFTFTSEPGATFECQLDAGAYTTCTSPKSYPGLAVGAHTFRVRATDQAGNTDASPATRTWRIEPPPVKVDPVPTAVPELLATPTPTAMPTPTPASPAAPRVSAAPTFTA
jgi:hypothetical protein